MNVVCFERELVKIHVNNVQKWDTIDKNWIRAFENPTSCEFDLVCF